MKTEKSKVNLFLYWSVCSVNLLSINSASMFSWPSPSIPKLSSTDPDINPLGRPITSSEESLIASLATLGAVVGTLTAGYVGEKIGRKKTLVIFSLPFFFGYLVIAIAKRVIFFEVTRFALGLSAGGVLAIVPSYVGELSEDSNRGAVGSIFGIMNSLGHFLAFGIGPIVSIQTFAYILLIPVLLFFVTFIPFVPESPYHFLAKDDRARARQSLLKMRPTPDVEKELAYLTGIVEESKNNKISWKDITSSVASRRGLTVCCGLLMFQQALGIGVILLYLQPILEAGGNAIPSYLASLLIAVIQILSCTSATFIVDRLGRKILLHMSSVGCSLALLSLGTFFILDKHQYNLDAMFWLPAASLMFYYVFFNIGYATIPWSICGELFATNVKSLCNSIASFLCLITSFAVSLCFPFVRYLIGMGGVFCFFGVLGMFASIFVALFVPETKGKSLQEIQRELSGLKK